jgi:hypothetical protein
MKKTDDTQSYFQKISDYIRKKRITPLLLSSTEGQILLDWEKKGVPIDIVIHTIDIAYEKFQIEKMKKKRGHFNIKTCKTLALKEWQKFLLLKEYLDTEQIEWSKIINTIKSHFEITKEKIENLKMREPKIRNIDKITEKILFYINSIQAEFEIDFDVEKVTEKLKNVEKVFVDLIIDCLDIDLIHQGYEVVEKKLAGYKEKIDKETFWCSLRSGFIDWLKKKMDLPDLILPLHALMEMIE